MIRRQIIRAAALLPTVLLAGSVVAQEAPDWDSASSSIPASTPLGSGPQPAMMEAAPGLPTHTVYHPLDLARAGRLPVVVWGNGACWNAGNAFRWFLSDIASYGYLVVAVGPIVKRKLPLEPHSMIPLQPTTGMPPAGQLPPAESRSAQLVEAIDWAVAENQRKESRFHGRLDTTAVAVMGQSCGGAQALEASADPRVRTTVLWNSGLFPEPTTMGGGKALSRADLRQLHGPTAFFSGDEEDMAHLNARANYALVDHVPVIWAYERGVLHSGTYGERYGGEFGGVAVGWLNWQLKGDRRAAKMFVGPDCGLCVNPRWVVQSKKLH